MGATTLGQEQVAQQGSSMGSSLFLPCLFLVTECDLEVVKCNKLFSPQVDFGQMFYKPNRNPD